MKNKINLDIYCIFVYYKGGGDIFYRSILSLKDQCSVVSVYNSTFNDEMLREDFGTRFHSLQLLENVGVGSGQNFGINYALHAGADYILLSDQDTVYPPNYVADMVACLEKLKMRGKIAAVCPNFFEVNRSELCPMIIDAGPLGFKLKTATSGLHKVCFANASGMIIPAQVFSDVGLMREDLFIDCVDTEWCTRAEHLGYSIYCNADMVITHSLGDRSINVLGRVITQHSPLRHYYLARNSMYLALYSKHLNVNKRLFFLLRAIKRVVGHAVLSAPRMENLRMGVLGIWHGVIGRLGKYD